MATAPAANLSRDRRSAGEADAGVSVGIATPADQVVDDNLTGARRRAPIAGGHRSARGVRVGPMDIRIQCRCVDSAEPKKIASFWDAALGRSRTFDEKTTKCASSRRRAARRTAWRRTSCF